MYVRIFVYTCVYVSRMYVCVYLMYVHTHIMDKIKKSVIAKKMKTLYTFQVL